MCREELQDGPSLSVAFPSMPVPLSVKGKIKREQAGMRHVPKEEARNVRHMVVTVLL